MPPLWLPAAALGLSRALVLEELLSEDELADLPILVIDSKQDLIQRSPFEAVVSLELLEWPHLRWRVHPCSLGAHTVGFRDGYELAELRKGLIWLVQAMRDEIRASSATQVFGGLGPWLGALLR